MTIFLIFIWLLIGYLTWLAVYYGSLKYWYIKFDEDLRKWNNGNNHLKTWCAMMPVIVINGLISAVIIFSDTGDSSFKHGITLYFKVPKNK